MEKTLLILGAGASKDFYDKFPTGLELIKEVNYHFFSDKKFPKVPVTEGPFISAMMNDLIKGFNLKKKYKILQIIKNELWKIQSEYEWYQLRDRPSQEHSIDRFIKNHIAEGVREGRINSDEESLIQDIVIYSIYYLIKGFEQAYCETVGNRNENWMDKLAQKLLEKYNIREILENLTVITFNYDRTFEYYFPNQLLNLTGAESVDIYEKISDFQNKVIHPYGSLGPLKEIPLQMENNQWELIQPCYKQMQFIDYNREIKITLDCESFKRIHFMGFGYTKENLGLLKLSEFSNAILQGTSKGLDRETKIRLAEEHRIQTKDCSCKEYIETLEI